MVSWEQLLLEKNAVFYCKGETMTEMLMVPGEDFGRHEMEQWKAVLLQTQEWGWGLAQCWWVLGSGHKPTPGIQPRGWFGISCWQGLAPSAVQGMCLGYPPTCPCWWHLPGYRGVSLRAGEMQCPPPTRQTGSRELFGSPQVWHIRTLRNAFYITNWKLPYVLLKFWQFQWDI